MQQRPSGGKVFFISDRDESSTGSSSNNDLEQATIDNLTGLGIIGVSDQNVLLRGEFTKTINGTLDNSKQPRREAVVDGSADGIQHQIVELVGDNLNDLDNKAGTTNDQRRAYVDANQDRYGVYTPGQATYIVLPNSIYGAWEGPGLYNPAEFGKQQWFQLTPGEKDQQRKENLDRWLPSNTTITSGGAQDVLNEQSVLSLNWFQKSGEYAASTYQAYNIAKYDFAQAIASGASNPAVILDLDETVLDNSAYDAGLVGTNNAFDNSTWYQWIKTEQAKAVPGAVDFINYVNANGGKVFFISDRDESSTGSSSNNDLEQSTINNLIKLGITGVSDETVLLRGEFVTTVNGVRDTSKQPRRDAAANGQADGIQHQIVLLGGDNLNDLDNKAGTTNDQRRTYVDANQNRYGQYTTGQATYIALPNPIYGAWEGPGLYDPAAFGKQQWFQLTPAEKNVQRKEDLIRWVPGVDAPFTDVAGPIATGGQKTFTFSRGDSLGTVSNFGGVGTAASPLDSTIAEADTLKFVGDDLTARNLILRQQGDYVIVSFDGISDTQVILQNVKLENLDNLQQSTGASLDLGNIIFDGQKQSSDSFDVINADSTQSQIWNRNTVTFLNSLNTTVSGFDNSDDVINATAGNHFIYGLSGTDFLRGGSGNNSLDGGDGDDILEGGSGNTVMIGGAGKDTFILKPTDKLDTIQDLSLAKSDRIGLADGLKFDQLSIAQGTGDNASDALIRLKSNNQLLAIVKNINASLLVNTAFITVDPGAKVQPSVTAIDHVVVLYMENRSFDGLYGNFPGADGLANAGAAAIQLDKNGVPYVTLPPILNSNFNFAVDPRFPTDLPNAPFNIDQYASADMKTGDLIHRYYQEQSQIDGGKMDKFVAYSDAGGLTMGYYDTSDLRLYKLAQEYTLDDAFFHSGFGGSFLNHIEFIAGTAPVWQNAPTSLVAQLDANGNLIKDGQVTPEGFAVNTSQPTYTPFRAGTAPENRVPPQTLPTIGDRLSDANVSWAWYSGGWNDAVAGNPDPLFQYHHQPFAYFANYGDGTPGRAEHLKDEVDFRDAIANNTLPAVSFVKPIGADNQHPGYADLVRGDNWAADLIEQIQNSPAWGSTAIIVAYDENGGMWDHVAPPVIDQWGPGSRVPNIVVSPYAKKGYIDHTVMETDSILNLIEDRFGLVPLGTRDSEISSNLLTSFDFSQPAA